MGETAVGEDGGDQEVGNEGETQDGQGIGPLGEGEEFGEHFRWCLVCSEPRCSDCYEVTGSSGSGDTDSTFIPSSHGAPSSR